VAETVVSVTHVDLSTAFWDRIVDGAIEYQRGGGIPEAGPKSYLPRPLRLEDSPEKQ
jgi:hypothetical protein